MKIIRANDRFAFDVYHDGRFNVMPIKIPFSDADILRMAAGSLTMNFTQFLSELDDIKVDNHFSSKTHDNSS